MHTRLMLLLTPLLLIVGGCAGERYSYNRLVENSADGPLITLHLGDEKEVLVVGNGFPGRWGFYPHVVSCDSNVAEIVCSQQRSWIPFREPGVVFGGNVCNVRAQNPGTTEMLTGNRFSFRFSEEGKLLKVINSDGVEQDAMVVCREKGIKVVVLPMFPKK